MENIDIIVEDRVIEVTVDGGRGPAGADGTSAINELGQLHIGNNVSDIDKLGTDTWIGIARITQASLNSNEHAFVDATSMLKNVNGFSFASFDSQRASFEGTANYDHHVSFQSAIKVNTTGIVDKLYGLFHQPNIAKGTVNNNYGFYISNPILGVGASLVNNYGIFITDFTAGTNRFAIYTAGSNNIRFGALATGQVKNVTVDANGVLGIDNTRQFNLLKDDGAKVDINGLGGSAGTTATLNIHRSGGYGGTTFSTFYDGNYGVKIGAHSDYLPLGAVANCLQINVNDGKIGVGIAPTQRFDVGGKIKLSDDAVTPTNGTMRYNSGTNKFQGYANSAWVDLH